LGGPHVSAGRKPLVLFVGAFPPARRAVFGGMVTSCLALMKSSFPKRVDLVLLDSTQISNPVPPLLVRAARAGCRLLVYVWKFERRRPDAVLLFVAVGGSIVEKGAMAWYARLRGVPAVMFPRGGSIVDDCRVSAFTRAWVTSSFRGARRIVCQSESWRRFAIEVLGFAPTDVAVVRNWTATRALLALGAGRAADGHSTVRLLFVGWLERDKGIFELLEAARLLMSSGRRFVLDVAGDGSAAAEARATIARHGLGAVVRLRSWLGDAELEKALRESDVLVLPSWAEGLPNAMVEAMAARLAVVVTRVGAIPEVVTHRRSAMLVEPRNPESLAAALAAVLDDPQLRQEIAAEGFRIAARDFEVEQAADRLVELILQAVAAGRDRRLTGRAL
jgi:glycosyltransferase involved in cell wall biosynthesis